MKKETLNVHGATSRDGRKADRKKNCTAAEPQKGGRPEHLQRRKAETSSDKKGKTGHRGRSMPGKRKENVPRAGAGSDAGKTVPGQFCPVQKECGGCQFLSKPYAEQLAWKQRLIESLMSSSCAVHKITGMRQYLHYRNKIHAAFTHKKDGTVLSGIYAEGTHEVIPVDECLLEDSRADAIIRDIRELLQSFRIKIYNENTGYGLFRHAMIRTAHQTGQILVVLVITSPIFPSRNQFVKALLKRHPEITTIVQNINDRNTSMVLGEKESVLYGRGYIEDELCGCRFRISPKSFYQVNSVQTEKLYAKAMELAHLTGKERVIDAYCGIGTISLVAAKMAREVIGVELNPDAVRDAVRNARMNHINNVSFYRNDAGIFMTQMADAGEHADVVFMDPPRSGSDEKFLASVCHLSPSRIVYISCNPETLARDVAWLTKNGYRAEGCWGYDMFPLTRQVETVVGLQRKDT